MEFLNLFSGFQRFIPRFYGSMIGYLIGFWINEFISGFAYLYPFQKITKIKMPLWIYFTSYLIFPLTYPTYSFLLVPIIYSLLIYFFITNRQITFSYILTNMLLVISIFASVSAVIGLSSRILIQLTVPTFAIMIMNYGTLFIQLIELGITLLILKSIQATLNDYTKMVLPQTPILVWTFNFFLFFRLFLNINFISPLFKVGIPPLYFKRLSLYHYYCFIY